MRAILAGIAILTVAGASAESQSRGTADIAAAVSKATVEIHARRFNGSEFSGTGFVVDSSGIIVTNMHVVDDSSFVEVRLPTDEVYPALGIVAVDRRRDIAVMKIGVIKLPTVEIGESSAVRAGEPVIVVGNALGMLENSVTAGVISGIRDAGGYKLIQMDAAISLGNSGGPVANDRGQVIGIATLKLELGESLNFAVPIDYVKGLLQLPVTAGLGLLKRAEGSEPSVNAGNSRVGESGIKSAAFPMMWRSLTTGHIKKVYFTAEGMRAESQIHPALLAAGAYSIIVVRQTDDGWNGVHQERINCRPMPLTHRRLCPVITMPARLTSIGPERIEGFGEEPLNDAPFDCRKCDFARPPTESPFVWVPLR
jgi:S1-C subfamily serine protease